MPSRAEGTRSSVRRTRRHQARTCARHLRHARSTDARRSTSARLRADSPTCCSSAARPAWSRSTSATASSTGASGTIPRVVVIERANARALEPADLPALVDIVTVDVSFISLRHIFPRVPPLSATAPTSWRSSNPSSRRDARRSARKASSATRACRCALSRRPHAAAAEVGLVRAAMTESPITGDTGNREFFLHLICRGAPRGTRTATPPRKVRAEGPLADHS